MKRILFICVLLLLSSISYGQVFSKGRNYSTTGGDTTAWVSIAGAGNKVLVFHAYDSCNVTISLDYRDSQTGSTYVYQTYAIVSDSTNSTDNTGYFKAFVLRYGTTNNIPGGYMARLRIVKKTTRNGTTSPTYDATITDY